MKATMVMHCTGCGGTSLIMTKEPTTDAYKVHCEACEALLAEIPMYGTIQFVDDKKEDTHAHPTE